MSYILEALKKSERQRPPGQVPDLFTVQGPMQSGNSRRPLLAIAVVVSIVVAAALGGWAWFAGRDRPAQTPPAQTAAPQEPRGAGGRPPESVVSANPAAVTPDATPEPAAPPRAKVPVAAPSAPPDAGRRTLGARPTGAAIAGPRTPAAAVPAASRLEPVPPAVETPAGGAAVQTEAPPAPEPPAAALPAAAPSPATIAPATPAPAAPVPGVVAVPAGAPEVPTPAPMPTSAPAASVVEPAALPPQVAPDAAPADGRVVSIEELPASVRGVLGNFAVSGHVWSEEPALRLLTVQDRIVREGGEAAPGVRLEEITQTGAVFTVRGWRFRTGY